MGEAVEQPSSFELFSEDDFKKGIATVSQKHVYAFYFDQNRKISPSEKANITTKARHGYMNAELFRRNMFNATSRSPHKEYKKHKVIYKAGENEIRVSHPLHQKHADILSLIFTDNIGVSPIESDGSYIVNVSLYDIAKKMGYKYPAKSVVKVVDFINEMRRSDFVIADKFGKYSFSILGKSYHDEIRNVFQIQIPSDSAKVLALSTGLKIEKTLNSKIVQIPDKLVKIKALVRYVISHKPSANGFTLEHIFSLFDIGTSGKDSVRRRDRSVFRRQLRENRDILEEFNIVFDDKKNKIFYSKHDEISFEMGISPIRVFEDIQKERGVDLIGKWVEIENGTYGKIVATEKLETDNTFNVKVEINTPDGTKKATIKEISRDELEKRIDHSIDEKEFVK